jgi:hypothetical protein
MDVARRPGREDVDVWRVLGGERRDPAALTDFASDEELARDPQS